jgi:hypothetical protein
MTRPVVSADTELLYATLGPWSRSDTSYTLLTWLDGVMSQLQKIDDLVRESPNPPGWHTLMDPNLCPDYALPWLGQLVGVTVDLSLSVANQRTQILNEAGFTRGTPTALKLVAQQYLTGTKTVTLTERDGSSISMLSPGAPTLSFATTGGTLAAATAVNYRIVARNSSGVTLPGPEGTATAPGGTTATNTATVSWAAVTNAASYDVYGRTTGGELFIANVTTTSFTDTGSIVPAGALPTSNTAALAIPYTLTVTVYTSQVDSSSYSVLSSQYATYSALSAAFSTYALMTGPSAELDTALQAVKPAGLKLKTVISSSSPP